MKTFSKFLPLVAVTVVATSCNDYDAGFTAEIIKQREYSKHFVQAFGEIDPEQDWSMAQQITANVSITGATSNSVVCIYSDKPMYSDSKGIGMFQGTSAKFNAVKGIEQVFAIVYEQGDIIAQGYYNVENGIISINGKSVVRREAMTRATGATCTAAKGSVLKNFFTGATGTVDKYKWKSETSANDVVYYTYEQLIAWGQARQSSMTEYNHSPFGDDCVKTAPARYDFSSAVINEAKVKKSTKTGYVCNPDNQGDNIYTLDELHTFVEGKCELNGTTYDQGAYGIFMNCVSRTGDEGNYSYAWDWEHATFSSNFYNVPINENDFWYHGGYHIDEVFSNEAFMKSYTETNGLKNDGPYTNCWFDTYKYVDITSTTSINTTTAPLVKEPINIDLTPLTGVEKSSAQPWSLEIGYNLFGPKGFFCEQNYYWAPKTTSFDKTTLYGSTDAEKLETMKKIESGFSITTKAGTIVDVPFIYGATQIPDIFGYVYYKEGQDPLTQPHYMLMSDGKPSANIYYNAWGTANGGTAVGDMALSGWASATPETPLGGYSKYTNVYGTKYTLAFFGENHDQPATHEFDAGYKIVFFISNTTDGKPTMPNCGNFNYSLPELNERLGHLYGTDNKNVGGGSLTYKAGVNPKGSVKAAAWNYKGSVFMGFEDGGNDEDLNDIVFWVEGDFETNDLVTVKTTEERMTTSWIFAAEDLGGTFDYDFNDVVWEVAQTNTHKHVDSNGVPTSDELIYGNIKINVLASGGTLPVELVYNEDVLTTAGKSEIHQLFGQDPADLYTPVNAGGSADKQKITIKEIEANALLDIDVFSDKFKLKVKGANGDAHYVTSPEKGQTMTAPQVILLPADWEWPTESTPITTAYTDFTEWVHDATWTTWASHKSGATTKRGVITGTANGVTITEETYPSNPTDPDKTYYTVTVSSSNETYGTVSGGGRYEDGSTITITATPKQGYEFVSWNDDNTNASREITVNGDITYTATFKEQIKQFNAIISSSPEVLSFDAWGSGVQDVSVKHITVPVGTSIDEAYYTLTYTGTNTDQVFFLKKDGDTVSKIYDGVNSGMSVTYSEMQDLLAGKWYLTKGYNYSAEGLATFTDLVLTFTKQ